MAATSPIAGVETILVSVSDAELLDRFVIVRDPEAFTELVGRHGTLVLGVCRRVLRDPQDIEDVFQATFLVLIRGAARIRRQQSVASWLYGVAHRLALRVARQKQRRRETMLIDGDTVPSTVLDELTRRHDQQLIDAELNALPERYRTPIVLRYLIGKPPREIAAELDISLGTLDGLLKRGKDQLRVRLMRRGVTLGVALSALQLSQQALQSAEVLTLIDRTVLAGSALTCGPGKTAGLASQRVLELSGKELVAMTTVTKSTLAAALMLGALSLGFGVSTMIGTPRTGRAEAGLVATFRSTTTAVESVDSAMIAQASNPPESIDDMGLKRETVTPQSSPPVAKVAATEISGRKAWDRKQRSATVVRIEAALQQPTEVSFSDNPLIEATNYLEDVHQIEIILDRQSLENEGISPETPITMTIRDVSLKSALGMMLEPLELDYIIKNEVLTILSRKKADETFETRVYDVARLKGTPPSELDEIIRSTITPHSWNSSIQSTIPRTSANDGPTPAAVLQAGTTALDETPRSGDAMRLGRRMMNGSAIPTQGTADTATRGGEGSIRYTAGSLIVRQTQRVHEEIVDLLNQLEPGTEHSHATETRQMPRSSTPR